MEGWSALYAYGIRTILSLHTDGIAEEELHVTRPYPDLTTVRAAIEDVTDTDFVQIWASSRLWCTPLYYRDALRRWPERHAAAVSAIARAQPGGILVHCSRGNDRTGIVTLLILTLAGLALDKILADYELSPDLERDEILAREQSSVRDAILAALTGLDMDN